MALPTVFISYSHDSPTHESKVLALANRLRGDGIDAALDQYESFPPRGWIDWMRNQIRHTQYILVVCTDTYRRRWDGDEKAGMGLGATYEGQIIQQLLYDAGGVNERFVPILLSDGDDQHLPLELRRYTYFPLYTEQGYEALTRLLTNQPKVQKPLLGPALPLRAAKQDFRNLVWNVPARNPFFTGRAQHLEMIRSALTQSSSAALTQSQAISGLGGIGKTQTAVEYAHRHRSDYPVVLWSGADSHDVLLSGFAALAHLLDLPQKDEPDLSIVAAAIRRWLESNSGWLLILDNVEDLNVVSQFVPVETKGHLLITTRLRSTGEYAELVELRKMEPEEGALFLLRRAKLIPKDQPLEAASEVDRALARQISAEMDGLPLALDQAGTFIEETPSTLEEYLALYSSEGRALRARRGRLAPSHPSVTITFSLAFASMAQANPPAADLVRGCAFLAPDAIPEEIFTKGAKDWGEPMVELAAKPLAWVGSVEEAGRFALIRRNAEDKSLYIHRLVQEVIKDELSVDMRHQWAERTVGALNELFPEPEFQEWPLCERLLAHARAATDLIKVFELKSAAAARLLDHVGLYLDHRGQYSEAEALYRRALAIQEQLLGPEHPDTAGVLNNLAEACNSQGRYREAEPLHCRALAIWEKVSGPEHPDTASGLSNLAFFYAERARYAEAEPLYKRALAIRERVLGPEHPDTSIVLNNLALLYSDQARYVEAESLFRRTLAIREKVLGLQNPSTAHALDNLALLYLMQGRHSEAEPLCRRALEIYEKELGPKHPDTGISSNNLAEIYRRQGRYPEAEAQFRHALAIFDKALGPEHSLTVNSLSNLAELYRVQARYMEAEPLYDRTLAIRESSLEPGHPDISISLNNLALLYYDQGRYTEAEPLFHRALANFEKTLGSEHPRTANSLNNLAELYRGEGRHEEALSLCRRALQIREKTLADGHHEIAQSLNLLAQLNCDQEHYDEAEVLCRHALDIYEKALGLDHPVIANCLNTQAEIYAAQGKSSEAEVLYRRALTIRKKALGPGHPKTASSMRNYSQFLRKLRHQAEAEKLEG